MRMRRALRVSSPILALAATLFCAIAFWGQTGARATGGSSPIRSSNSPQGALQSATTEGGRIAFALEREIYLVNSDGSGLTQLTHSHSDVYNYSPALSPDGTRVAFATVQGSRAGISIIDLEDSRSTALTTNNLTRDSEPAWSPDGSKIAFVRGFDPTSQGVANFSQCGPSRIYVVDVDSVNSQLTNLTPQQSATDPTWSPDGTRIAFASNLDGNYDIYSMASDGSDVQQLTNTVANEAEPVWSPDGRTIAYVSGYLRADVTCGFIHTGRGDSPILASVDIYSMSNDGSNQTRLTDTENNLEPTWSPDGTALAFVSFHGDGFEISVLDIYHKAAFRITSDSNFKSSPSWSRADPHSLSETK
jgi:Tol biopolymer transport system component